MDVLRLHISCVTVLLALVICHVGVASAATANFDDLTPGALTVPGTFASGGIEVTVTGPGSASVDTLGATGQSLRLALGAAASFDVARGTSAGSFSYYNVVSTLPAMTINGESVSFGGLAGMSGTLGGVEYSVTSNPWASFDDVALSGPISSFSLRSGSTPNALIVDEVAFVPEPSGALFLCVAAAALCRRVRR